MCLWCCGSANKSGTKEVEVERKYRIMTIEELYLLEKNIPKDLDTVHSGIISCEEWLHKNYNSSATRQRSRIEELKIKLEILKKTLQNNKTVSGEVVAYHPDSSYEIP